MVARLNTAVILLTHGSQEKQRGQRSGLDGIEEVKQSDDQRDGER